VGSEHPRYTDARIIAATNQNLEELVQAGDFREDLFFRLKVIEILVPPLRERRSDIPLLVRHILARTAADLGRQIPAVSTEVMAHLLSQDWSGNVRQLENVLTRATVLARGPSISLLDLEGDQWGLSLKRESGLGRDEGMAREDGVFEEGESLAAVERRHVQRVLVMTKGNKSAAARILEVSRPTLNRMIKDYGIVVTE
jgi:DNA-binding NtrC family response regulator